MDEPSKEAVHRSVMQDWVQTPCLKNNCCWDLSHWVWNYHQPLGLDIRQVYDRLTGTTGTQNQIQNVAPNENISAGKQTQLEMGHPGIQRMSHQLRCADN